jgi:hypothetical protein
MDTPMTTAEQQAQAIADLDTRTDRQEQRTYPHKPSPEQRAEYHRILTETR